MIDGQKVESGWMSQVIGITADKPSKIRGYRADLLIMEEAGSWTGSTKAYIQSTALVGPKGAQWGIRIVGGGHMPRNRVKTVNPETGIPC